MLVLGRDQTARRDWAREAFAGGAESEAILVPFTAPVPFDTLRGTLADAIETARADLPGQLVILIEEAQALEPATIAMIGRLLGADSALGNRLRVVLVGGPEVQARIAAAIPRVAEILRLDRPAVRAGRRVPVFAGLLSAGGLVLLVASGLHVSFPERAPSPAPQSGAPAAQEQPPPLTRLAHETLNPAPVPAPAPGLLLQARPGDTLESLYAKVYRGVTAPPLADVQALNPGPVKPGDILTFPAPPEGWTGRPASLRSAGR